MSKNTGVPASPSGSRASHEAASASPPEASIPNAGDSFTISYPFVRDSYTALSEVGYCETQTWRPGVRFVLLPPDGEDSGAIADAMGSATFVVEGVFKPGRFPTRVFFTRKFASPDGHVFGKAKLHISTLPKFRRLTRGYLHPFGIGEPLEARYGLRAAREVFERMMAEHASAIEARRAETHSGSVHESAVPKGDADA